MWVGLGLLLVVAVFVAVTYNALVRLRNKAEEAWSGIDVQLQRRADLVPNLVEAVKGYAGHERETFEEVTRARQAVVAATGPAEAEQADSMLVAALRNMFLLAEDYPELQASANFLALQRQLAVLEEDIAFARRYHNAVVEDLNTRIETFPSVLVAGPLGFARKPYFEAGKDERSVPRVDLSDGGPVGDTPPSEEPGASGGSWPTSPA
ncbi:LemA family protein [Nitriliruptoria bacterium AS10]|nr:LemA family protein [Salsipaludibacter albus]